MNAAFRRRAACALVVWTIGSASSVFAEEQPATTRYYSVSAAIASYVPGDSLNTYRGSASGSASVGGGVSLGVYYDGKNGLVTFQPKKRDRALILKVEKTLDGQASEESELDLSDMKPQTVDLGESKDGRYYYITFSPHVSKAPSKPKSLAAEATGFGMWQFRNSPVIVNDALYVGRLGGGGNVASLSISDIGEIEFSLTESPGWEPWGVLRDGAVTIQRPDDQTMIEILNTQNGPSSAPLTLPGGPYRVWVKWDAPSTTSEEAWEHARAYRDKALASGVEPTNPLIALLDKQLARSPAPWIISSGFHD